MWLGTVINTTTSCTADTDERSMSLQDVLTSILSVSSVRIPVRKLACVCGKIISLTNCVGNVSRLMTRNLFAVISSAWSWNSHVLLSSESLIELTCKVFRHMKLFNAKGSLIVLVWKSAHFWPLVCSDGVHWSNFIHDWVILPNFPNLFIACKDLNSIF